VKTQPLKRHSALQHISREHHQALMVVLNLKKAVERGLSIERLWAYVNWFFEHYYYQHISQEERFVFPLLGAGHPFVKQALEEHRELINSLSAAKESEQAILNFALLLEKHIRFEERQLFQELQAVSTETELKKIGADWAERDFCLNYPEPFWLE
jgi:hypothetical protein